MPVPKIFNVIRLFCLLPYNLYTMYYYLIPFILLFFGLSSAQNTYIDPTTTAALLLYSSELKKSQEKTLVEQKNLEKAQLFLSSQMAAVFSLQQKVFKGLSEVSTSLSGGIKVKEIYSDLSECAVLLRRIGSLTAQAPQYAVFGAKASEETYHRTLAMTYEISELLGGGELNLMLGGDRYRLLFSLSEKIKTLKMHLFSISFAMQRAARLGFLRAINPFQGYINTDKSIVEEIMRRYKHSF